jgi:hypothetical protein
MPPYFDGETISHELATSWFQSFRDYLIAHNLNEPADEATMENFVRLFKCRLTKQARLWVEDQAFDDLNHLKE